MGDDWTGEIPFVANARTRWTELAALGAGPADAVDFLSISPAGDQAELVKAFAVIYAFNRTTSPIGVGVCTASDDSIQVWLNDQVVTSIGVCRAMICDCSEINPGVLVPGKNKVAVVVWQGNSEWGFRLRLIRADGTTIDDTSDPDVDFSLDPEGCPPAGPFLLERKIEGIISECPGAQGKTGSVKIRSLGQGHPDELVTVTEEIHGQAVVSGISNGGVFAPRTAREPCSYDPLSPAGEFTDHRDIGHPCGRGETTVKAPGVYSITAGGNDIWVCGDQYQFAYRPLKGDFTVTAHVADRRWGGRYPPSRWGKFGLMARENCEERSRYAFVMDTTPNQDPPTPDGVDPDGIGFQGSSVRGKNEDLYLDAKGAVGIPHPDYLRLERAGNEFIAFASSDGAAWTRIGSIDWGASAPCTVLVGIAATSHAGCDTIEVDFDQLTILRGESECLPAPAGGTITWKVKRSEVNAGLSYRIAAAGLVSLAGDDGRHAVQGQGLIEFSSAPSNPVGPHFTDAHDVSPDYEPGRAAPPAGSTSYDPDTQVYTQVSSGSDIWDQGDHFHFAYREIAGDFDFSVQVVERIDPPMAAAQLGKHGLMARKTCAGNSKHVHLQTNTGGNTKHGPRLARRLVHGTNATSEDHLRYNYPDDGQRPNFLRLVRHRNTFYAYLSSDGLAWRPVGSDTWQDQDPDEAILVGFASLSHRSSNGVPSILRFRVIHFGPPEPLPPPLPDEGVSTVIDATTFDALTGFLTQHRNGYFDPAIVNGRLRMQEQGELNSSTSAFRSAPLEGIDSAIYQFDFDVFLTGEAAAQPADGLTFTLTGGRDASRVGFAGSGLGYDGLGRDRSLEDARYDRNISSNSFSVEFDTWSGFYGFNSNEGDGGPGNPGKYHLGIDVANNVDSVMQTSASLPDIFDPAGVHARVRYNRGRISVYLASNAAGGAPLTKFLEAQVLPISFLAGDESAVYGFTAGTGGQSEIGEVDNLRVTRIGPRLANRLRCDANDDGERDISDPVSLLTWLFSGGPGPACPPAVDCNSDGEEDVSDAVFDLGFQFLGGSAPAPPYPDCDSFPECTGGCP